jgi:alpha-glucosidase
VHQVYGGDLAGIEAHLDHLATLSVGGLYLTPFFPAPSSHRYDADTFDRVDPNLGGDDGLVRLVTACHDHGIRVIGDLTVNHVGARHEWFRTAQADAASPAAGFFHFRHHPDDYESWFDVPTLPKLDLRDDEVRRRLLSGPDSVTARWLQPPFDLDGWRVDVANMAGRLAAVDVNRDVARTMRATMAAVKADAYLVAEHAYDASRELDGDGWHGVMNYLSFTRPVWCWLRRDDDTKFLGDPLPVPRFGGVETARSFRELYAVQPWRSTVAGFNLLGSHDTSRFRTVAGDAARQIAGAGLLYTMPGVPMVFAGDEVGLTGVDGDGARRPMPWDESRWDREVLAAYRELGALHRSSRALRHGGLRWVRADDDVLVFLREARDERVLVQVARADHEPVVVAAGLDGEVGAALFGGVAAHRRGDGSVELPAGDAGVRVWELS